MLRLRYHFRALQLACQGFAIAKCLYFRRDAPLGLWGVAGQILEGVSK
jgi:hypothetical protein